MEAVSRVMELLRSGHDQVVDADLSGYFDSIPHAELMQLCGPPDCRSGRCCI